MQHIRLTVIALTLTVAGCNGEIYVRDGVTDGDTFYLADRALSDTDPALQSWVGYSLARSTCQLEIGGENPARSSSYQCELSARQILLDNWLEQRAEDTGVRDEYLDELMQVDAAGYLGEYTAKYFKKKHWEMPNDLDKRGFREWRRKHMPRHRPRTRIIGSWNYAHRVGQF